MVEEREVIIHITSDVLKHIHEDTKNELFGKFTFGSENDQLVSNPTHHKIITSMSMGYYDKMQKSFTTCFDSSISFFVSCVPNITNGKFKVKNIGLRFSDVLKSKNQSKLFYALTCIFSVILSLVIGGFVMNGTNGKNERNHRICW